MRTITQLCIALLFIAMSEHGYAQTTFDFNSPSQLTDNFGGDGNPVLSYSANGGLSGSGAFYQGVNNGELWVLEPSQGFSLVQGTYNFSAYFKMDNANSNQFLGIGFSVIDAGREVSYEGNSEAGLAGLIELNATSLKLGVGATHPGTAFAYFDNNTLSVSPGNWYKFEVDITYISGDEFNIVARLYASNANGVTGNLLGSYDYAAFNGNNLSAPQISRYTRYMPFLGMSRSGNSNTNPGFRTVDNFQFNAPAPTLPLASVVPVTLNLNAPNDLTNNFNDDGSPSLAYSANGGIGGSGAVIQTGGSPDSDTWTSKRAVLLTSDTFSISSYFRLDNACNDCQARIGLGAFRQNTINNQNTPAIELGVEGRGYLTLYSTDLGATKNYREPLSPSPLAPNNWYYLKLEIVPISSNEIRMYGELVQSDALGTLVNTLVTLGDTISENDGDLNRILANIVDAYPFFYVSNNNPNEGFGFSTIDGFSAGGPGTAVSVPTLSQWGLILLALTMMCIGGVYIRSLAPMANKFNS